MKKFQFRSLLRFKPGLPEGRQIPLRGTLRKAEFDSQPGFAGSFRPLVLGSKSGAALVIGHFLNENASNPALRQQCLMTRFTTSDGANKVLN